MSSFLSGMGGRETRGNAAAFHPDQRHFVIHLMLGAAYFLLGDRAPRDAFIADALRERIDRHFTRWIDQQEILSPDEPFFRRFTPRFRAFEAFMARQPGRGPIIIFGRSSGARVASYYACRRHATIAVCLGYPFRHPAKEHEPARYRHLAKTRAPTLILQGSSDPYGKADDLAAYSLSPSVSVRLIETDHNLSLPPRAWDEVADTILAFCRTALARTS